MDGQKKILINGGKIPYYHAAMGNVKKFGGVCADGLNSIYIDKDVSKFRRSSYREFLKA